MVSLQEKFLKLVHLYFSMTEVVDLLDYFESRILRLILAAILLETMYAMKVTLLTGPHWWS